MDDADGTERPTGLRDAARRGAVAVLPLLVGVVPFGLVAGASPVTGGLGPAAAVAFSVVVFAGASQLAATGVLADGGSWLVAVVVACTINLRMVLYSASLAPHLAGTRLRSRLGAAYLLTDQAYAVSIRRWVGERHVGEPPGAARARLAFYLGAAVALWVTWQAATVVGALIGNAVPDSVPLGFAVPLVFLVLLVPTVDTRPAAAAAVVGGGAAVAAVALGAGPLAVVVGAVSGVVGGFLVDRDDPAPSRPDGPAAGSAPGGP